MELVIMKDIYIKDMNNGKNINSSFMIMKKLFREGEKTVAIIGDKSGDSKANIIDPTDILKVGQVISVTGMFGNTLDIKKFKLVDKFSMEDYLPHIEKSIDEIMNEIKNISNEEFKSEECIELDNYFW